MPPRKATTSDNASGVGTANAQAQQDAVADGIENYELPRALVTRIAKSALPDNAKLSKETVLALVKGSTVFINYLAATAHDVAASKQHKSVSASDVLKALELIEFGDMVEGLQVELQAFRELQKGKKATTAAAAAVPGSASGSATPTGGAPKGKARAGPTISIPARPASAQPRAAASSSTSAAGGVEAGDSRPASRMDVDGEGEQSEAEVYVPGEDDVEGEVDAEEEQEEDEGEEPDEVGDVMAVEAEETRRDALGVVSREIDARRRREEEIEESGVLERGAVVRQ